MRARQLYARANEYMEAMRAARRIFTVILEPAEERPSDWYVATSPDLPGLVTQGKGLDDTVGNVKDAVSAYFGGNPPLYALEVRVIVPA